MGRTEPLDQPTQSCRRSSSAFQLFGAARPHPRWTGRDFTRWAGHDGHHPVVSVSFHRSLSRALR